MMILGVVHFFLSYVPNIMPGPSRDGVRAVFYFLRGYIQLFTIIKRCPDARPGHLNFEGKPFSRAVRRQALRPNGRPERTNEQCSISRFETAPRETDP